MLLTTDTHQYFTENILNMLQKQKVYSLLDFLRMENRHIERYTSLTYPEIIEVKKYLAKTFSAPPTNGLSYYQKILSHSALIRTEIPELDNLLQGGLFTGTIYEVCGSADSEKLHFILTIIRNVLCSGNKVYYLDTKRDFCAKLMKTKLANIKGQEESLNLLKRILIKQISDKYELISALFDIKRDLESGVAARIIVIHSISVVFLSSKDYTENNNLLNHVANTLRYLAIEHNVVIIVTNLITTWIEGGFETNNKIIEKSACGKYWSGIPNVRIKINKTAEDNFEISLLKFNNICSKEKCSVQVNIFV